MYAPVCLCAPHEFWCLYRPEENIKSGVTCSCEPPNMASGNWTWVLFKSSKQALLTTGPSLYLPIVNTVNLTGSKKSLVMSARNFLDLGLEGWPSWDVVSMIPGAGSQIKYKGGNKLDAILHHFLFLCIQLHFIPAAMPLLHDGLYPQTMSQNKSFLIKCFHIIYSQLLKKGN